MLGHRLQGHIDFQGLGIAVENRRGSVRKGVDKDGHAWRTKMQHPYGYIQGTRGKDGEEVDAYVGPARNADTAYVVHQHKANGKGFDEDKVMLGFKDLESARAAYLKHYDDPKFLGPVSAVPVERLKELVVSGKRLNKISQVCWAAMRDELQKCASHAVQQKINERQAHAAASVRTAQKWDRVIGGSIAVGAPLLGALTYGLLERRHREKKAARHLPGSLDKISTAVWHAMANELVKCAGFFDWIRPDPKEIAAYEAAARAHDKALKAGKSGREAAAAYDQMLARMSKTSGYHPRNKNGALVPWDAVLDRVLGPEEGMPRPITQQPDGHATKTGERIEGGLGDGRKDHEFSAKQLRDGIKVEREHTNDTREAKEIAKDHLSEIPDYYTRLGRMERQADREGVKHAGPSTPAGMLAVAKARGLPRVTPPAGRSIAKQYKPNGFGTPMDNAVKR